MAIGDLFEKIGIGGGGSGDFVSNIMTVLVGTVVLAVCGGCLWFFVIKRKKWNIKVEFKIPRNIRKIKLKDGSIKVIGTINKEWGKGYYDAKNGVVLVKRRKKKPVPMKPFDIKTYLSADNILTVIQVGIEDYRPVVDESYIRLKDAKTGDKFALVNAQIDTSEGKAWRNSYERERKNTYAISNWLREHGQTLAMGLVAMMILVGFGVLWTRLPSICG